jgi:protoporphyrinogen oxidase
MQNVKYLIIGAGPSGLTLAHTLKDAGVPLSQILVIEKEETVGGLCRSEKVDGYPLDIGGGHFLDVKHREVLDFIFRFMPEDEWCRYDRISKIHLNGQMIDHPLEANLWQFDKKTQGDYLETIAHAGCVRDMPMPESFAAWIRWKFGERIADEYMLPYNRKIWSMDPDELGVYWLYKLPNVSFRETLQSCLEDRPFGALPAHGVFLYPKAHGYGEVWRRMGEALGDSLITGVSLSHIDIEALTVNHMWQAEHILNSAPWHCWKEIAELPTAVGEDIDQLFSASIDVDYVPETLLSPAHWIYEPDESVAYHRQLLRANFCPNSRGHWTEANSTRSTEGAYWRHTNPYAYPINTIGKPACIARILQWAATHKITGFGRWGTWEHMNSDIAVSHAIALGRRFGTHSQQ